MTSEATVRADERENTVPSSAEYFAFPLTAAQAAMLPQGLADSRFNGAFRMSLAGRVDAALLQQSLREIAQRHEILRVSFQAADGDVLQVVSPSSSLTVDTIDLRSVPEGQRAAAVDEFCLREAQTVFDLAAGTPVRACLLRIENDQFLLTFTVHQIICDGWSVGLLMEELASVYPSLARREPITLPALEFQFGDYAVWLREFSSQPEVLAQLAYWKKRLEGYSEAGVAPDFVELGSAASRDCESEIVSQLLPRELTEQLRSLGQTHNTTFFVVSLAACLVLLGKYTGAANLAVRTPLAGRSRVEFEGIIGQFTNQVAIRSETANDPTIANFVAQTRENVWEALAHQDAAFECVVEQSAGPETSAENLFRINFVCQREYGRSGPFEYRFDGIRMTTLPSKSQGALYDLNFFLVEREAGWRLSLEYKTALYARATADSLLLHFREILHAMAADPTGPLSDVTLSRTEALEKRMNLSAGPSGPDNPVTEQGQTPMEMQAIPGSLAQERFWTLSQLDPSNPTFHIPVTMKLVGEVSAETLEQSFQHLVDRHETLRTTFSEIDGEFVQVIHAADRFHLGRVNLEADGKGPSLDAIVRREVERPFDLSSLPLFRASLCRVAPREHVLILTIHHTLADAWSVQVLNRELWTTYENLSLRKDAFLPPLDLQYADFSVWQREGLASNASAEHLDYWLEKLSGDLPALNFPTDHPPAYRPTAPGAIETLLLPAELSRSLKQFAQASDSTLFVAALACFALVLGRASEGEDIIIGSPVVNRRMETEPLIGPFAGPVVLRLSLADDPTLRSFVLSVRDTTLEALDHTDLPFEALLEKLTVRTSCGRNPLFQFYFFCQPAFLQSRELPELTVSPLPTTSLGIPFELQLGVIERAEGVRAELEYNSHLFDRPTIAAWLGYYHQVLAALVADPDMRISELPGPPFKARPVVEIGGKPEPRPDSTHNNKVANSMAPAPDQPEAAPDALMAELTSIWESSLGLQGIGSRDDFFEIGGRSLSAARLITRVNKKYSLRLGLATLFSFPTVEQLAQLIRGQLNPQVPSSIVAIQPHGDLAPLFVVHGVGGNVLNFYDLAKGLGAVQPVYGVEAQALQVSDTPLTSLEELAAYYVREVRKVQPYGPYNFLGYSYGGFVVFEMARQLRAANERVSLLGMLDTPIWRHGLREGHGTLARIGRQLMAVWTPYFQRLRSAAPLEIFDGVKSTILRSFYTVVVSQGFNIPRPLRSVYHINSFAAVNYIPKIYDGKITMLRASAERGPRDLGWGQFTTQPVEVYEIPGAHLQVLLDDNLPIVVGILNAHLSPPAARPGAERERRRSDRGASGGGLLTGT